jgi:large subunit ribosomal protein L35
MDGSVPKMKSHSGAKKRFKVTGGGKLRARHAMTSHIRVKKNAKRQRRLSQPLEVSDADSPRVAELLGR